MEMPTQYHCSAIIPFPLKFKKANLVVLVVLSSGTDSEILFFYSREQIELYVRDYWMDLSPEAAQDLIEVSQNFESLPRESQLAPHCSFGDPLPTLNVLANFVDT